MKRKLTEEIEPQHVHDDALARHHVVLRRPLHLRLFSGTEHQRPDAVRIPEANDPYAVDHRLSKATGEKDTRREHVVREGFEVQGGGGVLARKTSIPADQLRFRVPSRTEPTTRCDKKDAVADSAEKKKRYFLTTTA